jgi:hypothetical protein
MKNNFRFIPKMVWKGKAMLICFFLFAGCLQHDEGLAPRDHHNGLLSDGIGTESEEGAIASTVKRTFTAHLSGVNEVPAVDSDGQGEAIFNLSADGMELHYKLIVANIEDVAQAHIHCGEAGVNGPVVVFLFRSNSGPVTQNGVLAEGTITSTDIIPRPDSNACMGGLATFENLLERMRNGSAYVNAHTKAYPGGEIRGQIQ